MFPIPQPQIFSIIEQAFRIITYWVPIKEFWILRKVFPSYHLSIAIVMMRIRRRQMEVSFWKQPYTRLVMELDSSTRMTLD